MIMSQELQTIENIPGYTGFRQQYMEKHGEDFDFCIKLTLALYRGVDIGNVEFLEFLYKTTHSTWFAM